MKINLSERQEIRELGSGGFGNTKLFEDDQSHRFVLKTFAPQGSNDSPKALAMFKAECDRLQEVGTHPQIPSYLGFEETDGSYAIAQEYIPGESFREILKSSGPLTPDSAMEYLEKLLVPLKHMHSHQIIHRDIKPDNIILRSSDHAPCIVDFGAAKVATETILAQTGTVIGTASYAAPEQLAGQTSFQSDIYSLGLTIIEMLTSMTPFNLIDYSTGEWTWVEALQGADPRFVVILKRMVQRNLRDRYRDISDIQKDIANLRRFTLEEAEQQQRDHQKKAREARRSKE